MKLNEALKWASAARALPARQRVFLACGFEPLHLPVFLQAHYQARGSEHALDIVTGLFGDLPGNIERAVRSDATVSLVVIEWNDLDARLGLRSTGAWSLSKQRQIAADVTARLTRLRALLGELARRMPVVMALPSLSFSLAGHTTRWQLSTFELELEQALLGFVASAAQEAHVSVLHPARLARESPLSARQDASMELASGFPYRTEHASALARALLELAFPPAPKKGLITDLDDTLWSGIVGEVGVEALGWSQAEHAQMHGLYQSMLQQLAEAGILLAVASKNEPSVVGRALARSDLLLDPQALFPVLASWGPKSQAVSSVLTAWNIAADSVVMVDDSPFELEEIRRAHPGITCLEFSPRDPAKVLALLETLRDLFGRAHLSAEDPGRSASLRARAEFEDQKSGQDMQSFLADLGGQLRFDWTKDPHNTRLVNLLNKTNQFNLNGARVAEGEWLRFLEQPDSFVLAASYADRYGTLGNIGMLAGTAGAQGVQIEHWVLSCRAFSRRIEDHMLQHTLEHFAAQAVKLVYKKTERNGPLREFLQRLGADPEQCRPLSLSRAALIAPLAALPHAVLLAGQEPNEAAAPEPGLAALEQSNGR